jgi:hypothetical protein
LLLLLQFCGEAISARSGRKRATYTGKELKKDMEVFLQTGVHPHLQRVQQDAGSNEVMVALPDPDPSRPHVFLDITVDNKPAGMCTLSFEGRRVQARDKQQTGRMRTARSGAKQMRDNGVGKGIAEGEPGEGWER